MYKSRSGSGYTVGAAAAAVKVTFIEDENRKKNDTSIVEMVVRVSVDEMKVVDSC